MSACEEGARGDDLISDKNMSYKFELVERGLFLQRLLLLLFYHDTKCLVEQWKMSGVEGVVFFKQMFTFVWNESVDTGPISWRQIMNGYDNLEILLPIIRGGDGSGASIGIDINSGGGESTRNQVKKTC